MHCAATRGLATNTLSATLGSLPLSLCLSVYFTNPVCLFYTLHVIQSLSLSLSLLSLFTVPGVNADSSDLGVMEGRGHSVGGSDESPSEAEVLSEREERLTGAHDEQMSPDCSEDMEDSDSVASERLLSSGFRAEGLGLISSLDWALAFFGEECFSPDVIQYAGNLGQHTGSPCLDVKAQVGKATMATASESSLTLTLSVWTNGRCHDLFITFSCRLH